MNKLEKFIRNIQTDAWKTAGARFNAARRLEKREKFSAFSIAMFSAISLGIAVTQKMFGFPSGSRADDHLAALSALISLFVLVISLIEAGEKSLLKAEHLKQNADDLRMFRRKLEMRLAVFEGGVTVTHEEADRLRQEYENIIGSCRENHAPADLDLFLAKHRLEPKCDHGSGQSEPKKPESETPDMTLVRAFRVVLLSPLAGIGYFLVFWSIILSLVGVALFKY